MSRPGGSRFLVTSLAVHALGGGVLLTVKPRSPHRAPTAITIAINEKRLEKRPEKTPPPLPAPVKPPQPALPPPVPAVPPVRSVAKKNPSPPPPSQNRPPAASQQNPPASQQAANSPAGPATQAPLPTAGPPRKIDLVNSTAITVAVPSLQRAPAANWGGITRNASDGKGDPNERSAEELHAEATERLGTFLAEASSAERLKSGNVAPRWREAERSAQLGFHPAAGDVSDDDSVRGFLKQWMNSTPTGGGPTPRGVDPSREGGFIGMGGPGAGGSMEFKDVGHTTTEVEAIIAADGTLVSAKVIRRSGRRRFDQQALDLVKKACVAGGGPLDEKKEMVTHWSVEAWLNITPPAPALGLSFDESTGRLGANYPMKKNVQTRVKLISIYAKR